MMNLTQALDRIRVLESVLETLMDDIYQLEDPNGCRLQEIRLKAMEDFPHDSRRRTKALHVREEFLRSISR